MALTAQLQQLEQRLAQTETRLEMKREERARTGQKREDAEALREPERLKHPGLHVGAVDTDRAAADLVAV